MPAFNRKRFTRQYPADITEWRLRTGCKLQLQQLFRFLNPQFTAGQPRFNQCFWLRRKGNTIGPLNNVKRFDAKRITAQHNPAA